jgi:uncharacterized membrane protein (UPF0127 family)
MAPRRGEEQRSHDLRHLPVAGLYGRLVGLMGRRKRDQLFLVLPDCASVHTWFMRSRIDLVFLDGAGTILGVRAWAMPWRSYHGPPHTRAVVELPPGHAAHLGLSEGDRVGTRRK